ncbi:MAG TPA: Rrf2 family transcriptional regulator [Firmicutes bacterium]|jgi:Rrf2 family cysteine metabolism transcriptional repressor|nr:Rrf2 family transcriptional regulator [Bacillota bacterium]
MKISAKGRYALASMIYIAQTVPPGENITLATLSDTLDISKIYLEQVFSQLRRHGLVISVKGAQGGYQLAKTATQISAYDILSATENTLFAAVDETVSKSAPGIEEAMQSMLFIPLNKAVISGLQSITLQDIVDEIQRNSSEAYMYYV